MNSKISDPFHWMVYGCKEGKQKEPPQRYIKWIEESCRLKLIHITDNQKEDGTSIHLITFIPPNKPLCCKLLCKYHKTLNKEKKRNFETFVIQEEIKFYGFILPCCLCSFLFFLLLARYSCHNFILEKGLLVWNGKMFSYWLVIIFWLFEFTFLIVCYLYWIFRWQGKVFRFFRKYYEFRIQIVSII